jgi:hypothetical protein
VPGRDVVIISDDSRDDAGDDASIYCTHLRQLHDGHLRRYHARFYAATTTPHLRAAFTYFTPRRIYAVTALMCW